MCPRRHGGHVLQFQMVRMCVGELASAASAGEVSADTYRGRSAYRCGNAGSAAVLKVRFIHHPFVDDLRIGKLEGLLRGCRAGGLRRQGSGTHAVAACAAFKLITDGEGVRLSQLQVEPWRNFNAVCRTVHCAAGCRDDWVPIRIDFIQAGGSVQHGKSDRIDACIGAISALYAEEVGCFFIQRSADRPVVLDAVIRRRRSERVLRIEGAVIALEGSPAHAAHRCRAWSESRCGRSQCDRTPQKTDSG